MVRSLVVRPATVQEESRASALDGLMEMLGVVGVLARVVRRVAIAVVLEPVHLYRFGSRFSHRIALSNSTDLYIFFFFCLCLYCKLIICTFVSQKEKYELLESEIEIVVFVMNKFKIHSEK